VLTVKSVNGNLIRLTDERWLHIVEGHPEMAGHLNDVLFAIASPDRIFKGGENEMLAIVIKHLTKSLVVVYIETEEDGFIITAFFTTKIDKLFKRVLIWQK
jgi:hypothetical protein